MRISYCVREYRHRFVGCGGKSSSSHHLYNGRMFFREEEEEEEEKGEKERVLWQLM